jgi:hypothetical protein
MDKGMEMLASSDSGESGPMECPFGGSTDDEGDTSCPLAVGGTGPCGTSVAAAQDQAVILSLSPLARVVHVSGDMLHPDGFRAINLPPPRA